MPETLRHIIRIPGVRPDLGEPLSFLRGTVIEPPAVAVLQPTIDQQAKDALRKIAFRTLTRSKKDYLPTYHSRRGRRPRPVCPKCNRSYRRSEGHQCRGETQKFNLFPTGSFKKAA